MNIFKKIESLFGIVKNEYSKSVNSETFEEHLRLTKEMLNDAEVSVEAIGRQILERSAVLVSGIQDFTENIGSVIINKYNSSSTTSNKESDELDEIADRIKSNFDSLNIPEDKMKKHIEDIDFEEIKKEYVADIQNQSTALIIHKDQVLLDLKKQKEELADKTTEIETLYKKEDNQERVVYEAKIVDLSEQARQKANELLGGLREEQERFEQTTEQLNEKIVNKFTTHIDKINEVSKSITSDFDRLIGKMKDSLNDEK